MLAFVIPFLLAATQTADLSCRVAGTPAARPNDLVISNGGRTAVPKGTKLFWQVAGSGDVGFVQLLADLRPGERRTFTDVLERGQPVGTACGVSRGVSRVTRPLDAGLLDRRLECVVNTPYLNPLPGQTPTFILGVYNRSARTLPAGTHLDYVAGALKGRYTLDEPVPVGGEHGIRDFVVSELGADPDTVTCRITVGS